MAKLLNKYINGNYQVQIFDDGTKIRATMEDDFKAEFPENIDIKISDKCNLGCEFCHEGSTDDGNIANFNWDFLWTLKEGTELAIGGGNVFENPELYNFMNFCKNRGIIANITVNQSHMYDDSFIITDDKVEYWSKLEELYSRDLLNGVGISYNGNSKDLLDFYEWCNGVEHYGVIDSTGIHQNTKPRVNTDNFVIHVINGVHSFDSIMELANKGIKLLILGYKYLRRGTDFLTTHEAEISKKQKELYDNIHKIVDSFKVVSFDNLALEQLNIRRLFTTEEWEQFYMGDDGAHTMYIDLVKGEFAKNSTSLDRYKIKDNIIDMFNVVKEV